MILAYYYLIEKKEGTYDMKAVGIVAEYNPFHNGHHWHLQEAKRKSGCDLAIAVMSGNFLQRGEPACCDKWQRAHMAVLGGVDVVIELPFVFSVRSAQYFAANSVRLLAKTGVVSHLAFGTEEKDLTKLRCVAERLTSAEVNLVLHEFLKNGKTYAAALHAALLQFHPEMKQALQQPNTILAIEYLRALQKYAPVITPVAIQRREADYHDAVISGAIASATAIRRGIQAGQPLPAAVKHALLPPVAQYLEDSLLRETAGIRFEDFSGMILAELRRKSPAVLETLPGISEGLEYRLSKSALIATTIETVLAALKSKRYPQTRLQRLLIHALLGTTKEQIAVFDANGPEYIRVLAFNETGRKLLRGMQKQAKLPVITKTTRYLDSQSRYRPENNLEAMLSIDTLASDLYALALPQANNRQGGRDFLQSPLYFSFPSL